jgi:hypothetical protein
MAGKLGPRGVVLFGTITKYKRVGTKSQKTTGPAYCAPLKSVCDYFGIANEPVITKKGANGRTYPIRGERGGKHVLLPMKTRKGKNGLPRMARVPVPAGATISQIQVFLKSKIKKNAPTSFVSPDGRTYGTGF